MIATRYSFCCFFLSKSQWFSRTLMLFQAWKLIHLCSFFIFTNSPPPYRSSFTPNPSDYDNLSPAFVDDATALATAADFEQQQQHLLPSTLVAGEPPVYSPLPRGVPRRPESPRYTGGAFASRPRPFGGGLPEEYPFYDGGSSEAPPQNPFYSEDEFRCAARLRKLLYYLKKQYYLDNKYIQAVYGRNNVRY